MRSDMNQVLVDTYRLGGRTKIKRGRRQRDPENEASREGIRRPYAANRGRFRKEFGENLSPLYRWLDKQVGRPWDKVYSEICRTFDQRKVINAHILEHVDSYVDKTNVRLDDKGIAWVDSNYGFSSEVRGLYVHPVSGLLAKADPQRRRAQATEARRQREAELLARRRVVSSTVQLHNISGVWFVVELAKVSAPHQRKVQIRLSDGSIYETTQVDASTVCYDVLLHQTCTRDSEALRQLYGDRTLYGKRKHTASRQELKQYGIVR